MEHLPVAPNLYVWGVGLGAIGWTTSRQLGVVFGPFSTQHKYRMAPLHPVSLRITPRLPSISNVIRAVTVASAILIPSQIPVSGAECGASLRDVPPNL